MSSEFSPDTGFKPFNVRQKIAIGAVVTGALFGLYELSKDEKSREARIEECVSDLTGRPIDLDINPKTGLFLRPASVYEEVSACLESNGDSAEAKIIIDE